MDNPHIGTDVLKYLDSIIPDTTLLRVLGEQELRHIQLTQLLRDVRKMSGMTHEQIAAAIDKDVEWVKQVEDCNYPLMVDDFVAYLYALNANFKITVSLPNGEAIKLDSRQVKR